MPGSTATSSAVAPWCRADGVCHAYASADLGFPLADDGTILEL
ncbi:hypothetical protein [Actinoallomurus sp. NPDC050550]